MIVKDYSKEVLAAMERASEAALVACAIDVEGQAALLTPVDTGRLRGSITYRTVHGGSAKGKDGVQSTPPPGVAYVGTNVDYAAHVEFGTRPHFPPVSALKQWAKKKLGDEGAAYAVAKKISKTGTKPQSFLRKAADERRKYLPEIYTKTFQKVFVKK